MQIMPWKNPACSTTLATGCTDKSRGIVVGSVQAVAAIANDESLQVLAWYLTSLYKIGNVGHQQRELWASSIAILHHPPVGNEELRLSFPLAHCIANGERD